MPIPLIDLEGAPILGHTERMPDLLTWSQKSNTKKRWVEETSFGLRTVFSNISGPPKAYLYWNQNKFISFLRNLGKIDSFRILTFGVEVYFVENYLRVSLVNGIDGSITLYEVEDINNCQENQNNFYCLTGVASFTDEGPYFYHKTEHPDEVEVISAVKIVNNKSSEINKKETMHELQ